jgi:peptidyl-tRNA hydrolase, PTH1 family
MTVLLAVGLGNPGEKYSDTRHNAGFWFVDHLASHYGANFQHDKKIGGDTARITVGNRSVWLLKPGSFMNHSGQSVGAMARFYRIDAKNILIAHDELDFLPGTAKLKSAGGHGGHNGLRDIISHLSSREFKRLRIGIGHPGASRDVANYVLHSPPKTEKSAIEESLSLALSVFPSLIQGEWQQAVHQLHQPDNQSIGN